MKPPRYVLSGISVVLVLLLQRPAHAAPVSTAEDWLNHYYENPHPERFESAINELSRRGYFEQPGHVPLAIGFIAGMFRQNPEQIDLWVMNCRFPAKSANPIVCASITRRNPAGPPRCWI